MKRAARIFFVILLEAVFWFVVVFGLGGLLYVYMRNVQIDWRPYLSMVFAASLSSGVFLAITVSVTDALFCASLRKRYGIEDPSLRAEETVEVPGDLGEAFSLAGQVLDDGGLKKIQKDEEKGEIRGLKPFSFITVGERITLGFEETDRDAVIVRIKSRPKYRTTMIDFGRNALNVRLLARALGEAAGR